MVQHKDSLHFIYPFTHWFMDIWVISTFLAIMDNYAMNISVQCLGWMPIFDSQVNDVIIHTRNKITELYKHVKFLRNCQELSK